MQQFRHWTAAGAFAIGLFPVIGCGQPPQQTAAPSPILKPPKTDKIGEFDPASGAKDVDLKPKVTDPVTGPLAILKYEQVKLPMLQIEHALNLFNAEEGRYPNTHAEFMQRIIKANNLTLPQLAAGQEYQYDVEHHTLRVVQPANAATDAGGAGPQAP
jgi:hypothetical protein